jgi:hypothetical protein
LMNVLDLVKSLDGVAYSQTINYRL